MSRTFASIISLFLLATGTIAAQAANETVQSDSIFNVQKYGLRVGVDLSKPFRTLIDDNYSGFEIMADYRLTKNIYPAIEFGNEQRTTYDDVLTSKGSGSYVKIGADYNMHKNWAGLNNMIYMGLRYGFSTFSQDLIDYTINTQSPVFPVDFRPVNSTYDGLNAQWVELIVGVKTEIATNLFLTLNLQLKRRVSEKAPENFENLYIPGFNRTYENSSIGAGFSYGISYLIPLFKK
ncbi:MAG TPA: DUF6048 family protein [Flavobacteriaceae bacterium]|nr:DUF6048 family protein [Flavobacteriaceae bacterium]